ncbi:MAG: thioredoxin family protein [Acidilobaceae archaeon]|nr:thioredoxin family protein [Acidilobaceae archaeon]MCX8165673.1 thioredoxin family protein [Acidilobaceae archaeon]MDW7974098.1 thioredoxin family protein [Sulfolobales archaeon]
MGRFYYLDLSEEFRRELEETLAGMVRPVTSEVYVGSLCEACSDTVTLMEFFKRASPVRNGSRLLEVRVLDYEKADHKPEFKKRGISRIPTVSFVDGLVRWTGIPAGEEIRALVETVMRLSEDESGLEEETKKILATIKGKVHIETIVTPSCPYCPYAVLLSHMIAFEAYKQGNPVVLSEAVEAYENPDIADKYSVMTVPAVAINGQLSFVGVPYEEDFVQHIKSAAEGKARKRGRTFGELSEF